MSIINRWWYFDNYKKNKIYLVSQKNNIIIEILISYIVAKGVFFFFF